MNRIAVGFAVVVLLGAPAAAQEGPSEGREQMERRFRQRAAEVVRTQLGLTADQMTRLRQTNQKMDRERREVIQRERSFHVGIREELALGEKASQPRVAALLDSVTRVHRDRAELLAAEQRELATFMTPVQRAKYFGLQTQMRRRMDDMRDRRGQGRMR